MEKSDYKKMNELVEGKQAETSVKPTTAGPAALGEDSKSNTPQDRQDGAVQANDEPPYRLPPDSAIAGVLIRDWAEGKIGFFDQKAPRRNNL